MILTTIIGPKKIETKSRLIIDKQNTVAKFNESFTFSVTLQKALKGDTYQEKKAKIGVYAISPSNKVKVIGECLIDLAPFAAVDSKPTTKLYKLQNCIDKNATIEIETKATLLEKVSEKLDSGQDQKEDSDDAEDSESTEPGGKKSAESTPQKINIKSLPMFKGEVHSDIKKPNSSTKLDEDTKVSGLENPVIAVPLVKAPQVLEIHAKMQKMLEEKNNVLKQKQDDENVWKEKLKETLKSKDEIAAKYAKLQEELAQAKAERRNDEEKVDKKLQDELNKIKSERDEEQNKAKQLKEQISNLENENTKLMEKNSELEEKQGKGGRETAELEDEIRLYKEKVAQLMKQKTEQHAQYTQATSEVTAEPNSTERTMSSSPQKLRRLKETSVSTALRRTT